MKKIALFSAGCLLALATACAPEAETLKTGDLVFVGIPADYTLDPDSMDSAIADATGDAAGLNLIHTAILDLTDGEPWIIDATIRRGVDRHPLDTFLRDFTLRDGSLPVFEIKRLRDDARAEEFVANARQYLGLPYDSTFLPNNDAFYCTELVYCSYLDPDGNPLFRSEPMNFKNAEGEFPLYWKQLFDRLGQDIPQGVPGTNPQGMAAETILRSVDVPLYVEK